jgi:hypothetical protein
MKPSSIRSTRTLEKRRLGSRHTTKESQSYVKSHQAIVVMSCASTFKEGPCLLVRVKKLTLEHT